MSQLADASQQHVTMHATPVVTPVVTQWVVALATAQS